MTTLNPEKRSFTFHHVANKDSESEYRWDCNTCRVYWNDYTDMSNTQSKYYELDTVRRFLEQGVWVVDTVKKPQEVIILNKAFTFGMFLHDVGDVVPLDVKAHYTAEWDYSDDYGIECFIDIERVYAKVKEVWVELPMELLEGEIEYLEDSIVEEVSA